MKNPMYAEERRNAIVELVKSKKRIEVHELSDLYEVSTATIRTDLTELEKEGFLKRTHGGAISTSYEREVEIRPVERVNTTEKINIAKKAVELIRDNEFIAIDTGTSCNLFVEELIKSNRKNLTILTYDLKLALLLSENTNYRIQILGGIVRNGYPYIAQGSVLSEITKYNVDKAIVGTTAMDTDFGFSTPNHETAEIKRKLLEIAKTTLILCDHSKMNKRSFCSFAKATECDYLIVDEQAKQINLQKLIQQGIEIIYA